MVFLSEWRTEKRHEPVAGKLRRRPSIAMHLGEARFEKRADEIAHPLGPEAFGQRSGVYDVAEEHAHLLHFAGERGQGVLDWGNVGPGYIGLGCRGILQAGPAEGCPALAAEPVFRRVGGPTRRTPQAERRPTLAAELHAGRVVRVAPRASHSGPPGVAPDVRARIKPNSRFYQRVKVTKRQPCSTWASRAKALRK